MAKKLTDHDKQRQDDAKVLLALQKVEQAFSMLEIHYDKIDVNDLKCLEEVRQIVAQVAAKYQHAAKAD
jgi:hypothetical protein